MASGSLGKDTLPSWDMDTSYFDCMSDASNSSLKWSLKEYQCNTYMFANGEENKIKENVMSSQSVSHAIDVASEKDQIPRIKMEGRAKEILDEIAHTSDLKTIRFMAFMLSKIVNKLFRHIYVNRHGIQRLSEQVKFAPVVLVPTHNSYFDFLLASLVCFAVDLPLPAIASGQDFLHIAVVNRLLRRSGAFFLRRSFATDHFYKSIFTEYVQQVIKDGRMPMEFFLEGTRSRSGKALHPKTGMLSMISELFLFGHVPDVLFCPLSISYETIAEEHLYLFELLGIPKPKESLRGLIKTRKVLSSDYGTVHLHFGDVISLKDFLQGSISRAEYTLFPRNQVAFRSHFDTKKEKIVVRKLAEHLVNEQQSTMMIYPRSLIAAGVLENIKNLDDLEVLFDKMGGLLSKLGRKIYSINSSPTRTIIKDAVEFCSPVLQLDKKSNEVRLMPYEVSLEEIKRTAFGQALTESSLLSNILSSMYLSLQRNKLLHSLLIPACIFVAARCCAEKRMVYDDLLNSFSFILTILHPEFVRRPNAIDEEDLSAGLDVLQELSFVDLIKEGNIRFVRVVPKNFIARFLSGLIKPFLVTYWLVAQYLMDSKRFPCEISRLAQNIQLFSASVLQLGVLDATEPLSLQTLKNAISSFKVSGCLITGDSPKSSLLVSGVNREKLQSIVSRLGSLARLPNILLAVEKSGKAKIKAKI